MEACLLQSQSLSLISARKKKHFKSFLILFHLGQYWRLSLEASHIRGKGSTGQQHLCPFCFSFPVWSKVWAICPGWPWICSPTISGFWFAEVAGLHCQAQPPLWACLAPLFLIFSACPVTQYQRGTCVVPISWTPAPHLATHTHTRTEACTHTCVHTHMRAHSHTHTQARSHRHANLY